MKRGYGSNQDMVHYVIYTTNLCGNPWFPRPSRDAIGNFSHLCAHIGMAEQLVSGIENVIIGVHSHCPYKSVFRE